MDEVAAPSIDDYVDPRCFQPMSAGANCPIPVSELEKYNHCGSLLVKSLIPEHALDVTRVATEQLFEGGEACGVNEMARRAKRVKDPHNLSESIRQVFEITELRDYTRALNGPSVIHQSFLFRKAAKDLREKPWHQDSIYWDTDGTMMAAFIALDDCPEARGCIWVIDGSHKIGRLYHHTEKEESGWPNLVCSIEAFREPRPVPMEKGDVLFCHGYTLHASFANTTDVERTNLGFHLQRRKNKFFF